MATAALDDFLTTYSTDADLRERFASDRPTALEAYPELSVEERSFLETVPLAMLDRLVPASRATDPHPAQRSRLTFKEIGAMVLSGAIVAIFVPVLWITLAAVNTDPRGVTIGETTHVVSAFANAKDLLTIVLPLLGAVITFWLGVAVEGRRADANGEAAEVAKAESDQAKANESETRTIAADALGRVDGALSSLGPAVLGGAGYERHGGMPGGGGAPRATEATSPDVAALREIVADARARVRR